jgi:hypothetical protein
MRSKQISAACPRCGRAIRVRCQTPCHLVHLLLSLATQGLWAAVWLLLALRANICRCRLCGSLVWIAGARPVNPIPLSARPGRDRRRTNSRFGSFLVESGLVYYAPTR